MPSRLVGVCRSLPSRKVICYALLCSWCDRVVSKVDVEKCAAQSTKTMVASVDHRLSLQPVPQVPAATTTLLPLHMKQSLSLLVSRLSVKCLGDCCVKANEGLLIKA